MADVSALTGDMSYARAAEKIWHDIVDTKMHIIGGLGATHGIEGFGPAYDLPNRQTYNETCAAVANVMFNFRMYLLHKDARYFDVAEVALLNNSLAGMGMDSLTEPVTLGIILGLVVGKQVGIFSFAWLSIKSGIAKLPNQVSMAQIYGASILCGVGFTMSLFISSLAFEEVGMGYSRPDRLAIIVASLECGVLGYVVLKLISIFQNRGQNGS